jgi:hypothetical protein
MTKLQREQSDSTNGYHFKEETLPEEPQTHKEHDEQNWRMGETVFQNSKSGEKAPGLSNGVRYPLVGGTR